MSQERNLSPSQGSLGLKNNLMRPLNPGHSSMLPQVSPSLGSTGNASNGGSKFFNKGPVKPTPQMLPTEAMIRQSPHHSAGGSHPFGMSQHEFDDYYDQEYGEDDDYGEEGAP